MSVILALIPTVVVGLPFAIVNSAAKAVGIKLIDEKKIEEKNARRMGELLQKKQLNLLEKKELKLLQLGGNQPVFSTETQQQTKPLPSDELIIPTSIRNIEFLLKTLQELGTQQVVVKEETIIANFSQLSVIYQPDDNGYINLHFRGNIQQEDGYQFKDLLETQYGKLLQEAVYHQIKQRAEKEGLKLENEQVEEDDTITLTYKISMSKEITISIDKNGLVKSHIAGTPGHKCMDYLELLEKIVGGEIISHQFTQEYYQNEQELNEQQQSEQIENKI